MLKSLKMGLFNQQGNCGAKRDAAAYTLVEVMVSVLVVGIMTLSLYSAFSYGFSVIQMTREDLRATQILTQKMESIRLCTWSSLSNCPINFTTTFDPNANGNGQYNGTVYSGTISTNVATGITTNATYRTNMCLVTATIGWTNNIGAKKVAHSRQMQTYIARYGLQNYIWGTVP